MSVRSAVLRRGTSVGDEEAAALSAVFAITAAAGGMAALIAAVNGEMSFVAVPTILLLAGIVARRPGVAGLAGTAVWISFAPMAHAEAMIVPLTMTLICAGIAVGPARLLGWVRDDWTGRQTEESPMASGWIEDSP